MNTPLFESPLQLALIGLVAWLIGALIHPLAILAPLGLVVVLLAGILYLARPRSHSMYWRGRRIDLDDPPGPAQQFYSRLFRR
jgi:hypothetical protein